MENRRLYYEDIFKELEANKIRYLLIGGIAVNLYGVQRATNDIDLMLSMDKENLLKFIALSKKLGLVPRAPVRAEDLADEEKLKTWREEKNMLVFSFIHPEHSYITIDIMTENPLSFEGAYQQKVLMPAWGAKVACVSLKDLIKLKELSGREQDLADAEALKKYGEEK